VIVLAVRWYLRFSLSYRDVEELLAERGIEVDHVTSLQRSLSESRIQAQARHGASPFRKLRTRITGKPPG
jgi:transposase-like protein